MTERTAEQDRQIGVHEAGHITVGRSLGSAYGGATLVPGVNFSAKVWGPGGDRCSALSDAGEELYIEARPILPSAGELRDEAAPLLVHSHIRCVELLAGHAAEAVLHPDATPLNAGHDRKEAGAYAAVVCCSPTAIDAFLGYAFTEAKALIERYRHVVVALADALVEKRTLSGEEIDAVIYTALVARDQEIERARRRCMAAVNDNAKKFLEELRRESSAGLAPFEARLPGVGHIGKATPLQENQ